MIRDFLENNGYEFKLFKHENIQYYIIPFGALFEYQKKYYISFDIEEDKSSCFNFYFSASEHFKYLLNVYVDCYFEVNEFEDIEIIMFGDNAKKMYIEYVRDSISTNVDAFGFEKEIVYN